MGRAAAGLEWDLAQPGASHALQLAGAVATFWQVRGHASLGRRWLDAALAAAGPGADPRLRAIALDGAGQLAGAQADHEAQRRRQQQSLAIWRSLGDGVRTASTLGDLGAVAHLRSDYPAAQALYAEALDLARRAGESSVMARCLSGLGRLALHTGDQAQATAYYTESMSRFRAAGDLRRATVILGNLGVVAFNECDFDLAAARLTEHLANARKLGDRKLIGGALTNLGTVLQNTGDPERGAQLHAEALALAEQVGDRRLACVALTNLGLAAVARKDYPAARCCYARSLEHAEAIGERRSIAECLEEMSGADAAAGLERRAAVLFGASQAMREAIGSPILGPDLARIEQAMAAVRLALGDEPFAAAERSGRAMSEAEAITFARADPGHSFEGLNGTPSATAARNGRHCRRVVTAMTATTQAGGASPVDFATFGDYGDFRRKQPQPASGEFVRPAYPFRGRISADGSSGYPAVPGRYHLYISWACPWAHRTAIVRKLLGLEEVVSLSAVDPIRDGRGWAFREGPGHSLDPVNGFALLREAYEATEPGYDGHVSVPVLWDRETGKIVSNNFPDITIDLDTQFGAFASQAYDLYPEPLRPEIDAVNAVVYETVNNGVYRSGMASSQEAYHDAVSKLFATLDDLEQRLAGRRYLLGDTITEADVRLWVTLARFDAVYHYHFKVNLRRLTDYPNLWAYARDLYSLPAFRDTTNFDHIRRHYYTTHPHINPTRIVPDGPLLDWDLPHNRPLP